MLAINPFDTNSVELPTGRLTVTGDLLQLDELCGFGARQNPKRGFLFVSKVLGKHYPSSVESMENVHRELAKKLMKVVQGQACFIGLAETAVGLAQGVFEQFESMKHADCCFSHSTRYRLEGYDTLDFEESHSHAPDQILHIPEAGTYCRELFDSAETLVLIDDEISTGKTLRNLTKAYKNHNPDVKRVVWVSLTNFSGIQSSVCGELPIETVQLFNGDYTFEPNAELANIDLPDDVAGRDEYKNSKCHSEYGRTGIDRTMNIDMSCLLDVMDNIQPQKKVLVVGSGEWMHAPFLIAREIHRGLRAKDIEVFVQSTTRSPALLFGEIQDRITGKDTYGDDITNYLYNVKFGQYDHVFFCTENEASESARVWSWHLNAHLCYLDNDKLVIKEKR